MMIWRDMTYFFIFRKWIKSNKKSRMERLFLLRMQED